MCYFTCFSTFLQLLLNGCSHVMYATGRELKTVKSMQAFLLFPELLMAFIICILTVCSNSSFFNPNLSFKSFSFSTKGLNQNAVWYKNLKAFCNLFKICSKEFQSNCVQCNTCYILWICHLVHSLVWSYWFHRLMWHCGV